ncbi:unnamed protein product, partial [Laminaria digitata]
MAMVGQQCRRTILFRAQTARGATTSQQATTTLQPRRPADSSSSRDHHDELSFGPSPRIDTELGVPTQVVCTSTTDHTTPTTNRRQKNYHHISAAVVAVVLAATTASSANPTAGREDSSEHLPAVDGRLHHLHASTVPAVRAALQDIFCC